MESGRRSARLLPSEDSASRWLLRTLALRLQSYPTEPTHGGMIEGAGWANSSVMPKDVESSTTPLLSSHPTGVCCSTSVDQLPAKGRAGCLARPPARPFSNQMPSAHGEFGPEGVRLTGQSIGFGATKGE